MNQPLISIIVPIYMIDRYIGLCIESIINQTYGNLEIILVDDGGKDRCPEICDLYQKKDRRIKVIHKPNGGLVSARKAGLQQSNGAYISYVDGDDWIGPHFIEELFIAAAQIDADMVCAGFKRDLFSKSVSFTNAIPTGVYAGEDLIQLWKTMASYGSYYRPGISTYVWNKLFKREVLLEPQSMVDNRISIGEDAAVTYPALLRSKRVVVIDNTDYHYRQREDSMLKQSNGYSVDAQKLRYLHKYLIQWAERTPAKLNIRAQVTDYILSIAIMRSGGRLPQRDYSTFKTVYYGTDVVVFSAGTFGQQLVNRIREAGLCNVVAWIDDDYWEYRRCCLNVDPVQSITNLSYEYVLIATVDNLIAEKMKCRLMDLAVSREKILTIGIPDDKETLVEEFLNTNTNKSEEGKRKGVTYTHA